VQAQQDLKPMRVGEQVEALGPASGVDIGQGRRHTFGVRLVTGLLHASNLNPLVDDVLQLIRRHQPLPSLSRGQRIIRCPSFHSTSAVPNV
jgi:hypothetical protein